MVAKSAVVQSVPLSLPPNRLRLVAVRCSLFAVHVHQFMRYLPALLLQISDRVAAASPPIHVPIRVAEPRLTYINAVRVLHLLRYRTSGGA